jgi:hypothetical protein
MNQSQSISDRMFSSVPFLQDTKKVSSGDHANVLAGQPRKPFVTDMLLLYRTGAHFEKLPLLYKEISHLSLLIPVFSQISLFFAKLSQDFTI